MGSVPVFRRKSIAPCDFPATPLWIRSCVLYELKGQFPHHILPQSINDKILLVEQFNTLLKTMLVLAFRKKVCEIRLKPQQQRIFYFNQMSTIQCPWKQEPSIQRRLNPRCSTMRYAPKQVRVQRSGIDTIKYHT